MNPQTRPSLDSATAIRFDNVEKSYGSLNVLQGISGYVNSGEVLSIIGTSGCGKSTLLRCLNRLEQIDKGHIVINQMELTPSLRRSQLRQLRSQVGMVFQQFNLFPHLTVMDNLTLAPREVLRQGRSESEDRARTYLEQVGLGDKAQMYPDQLSGGQKQRVAIARSLCMEPNIILFDEPTSALDPELVGEVLLAMRRLAERGMTMVVVTHEIQFARDVASRVMFLDRGVVVEEGNAREVLTRPKSDRLNTFLQRIHQVNA